MPNVYFIIYQLIMMCWQIHWRIFKQMRKVLKLNYNMEQTWWFSDTERGMREQMLVLANQSLLWNFVGMLTDSRSFLSYQRHDYFRRILVSLVTEWIESGRIPYDEKFIDEFLSAICYKKCSRIF